MPQFAVIGLSAFGERVGKRLSELGCQVLVIDRDRDRIQEVKNWATEAVVADAIDKDVLAAMGLKDVDAAVVSLGDQIDLSILVTLSLKELGVRRIIVKGITPDHAKVLKLVGADEVIFPEEEMATRIANRLSAPRVIDQIELAEGFSIVEILPPKSWVGKNLRQLRVREKYNVDVTLIKKAVAGIESSRVGIPDPSEEIGEQDRLFIVGEDPAIAAIKKL
jgi:trk system potassium uptake protein TrkA